MKIQVGTIRVDLSLDGGSSFANMFLSVEATITLNFDHIDRINDGFIVGSESSSVTGSFDMTVNEWSIEAMTALLPFDYLFTFPEHRFTLTNIIGTSKTCMLKFIPLAVGKAATVILPKVRFGEDLSIPFGYSSGSIPLKGVVQKDLNMGFIIIRIPEECLSVECLNLITSLASAYEFENV